jgi:hypothetical protein
MSSRRERRCGVVSALSSGPDIGFPLAIEEMKDTVGGREGSQPAALGFNKRRCRVGVMVEGTIIIYGQNLESTTYLYYTYLGSLT